jgi:hypothetical protein
VVRVAGTGQERTLAPDVLDSVWVSR